VRSSSEAAVNERSLLGEERVALSSAALSDEPLSSGAALSDAAELLDSCSSSCLCIRSCSARLGVEVFGGESFEKVMVSGSFESREMLWFVFYESKECGQ
jgi:hypothetical protein